MAAAPPSLMHSAEREVITGLTRAARSVRSSVPFAAGGSLGRLDVRLAIEDDAADASGSAPSERPRAEVFQLSPEAGEGELQALFARMQPAKLGKGRETGAPPVKPAER